MLVSFPELVMKYISPVIHLNHVLIQSITLSSGSESELHSDLYKKQEHV